MWQKLGTGQSSKTNKDALIMERNFIQNLMELSYFNHANLTFELETMSNLLLESHQEDINNVFTFAMDTSADYWKSKVIYSEEQIKKILFLC